MKFVDFVSRDAIRTGVEADAKEDVIRAMAASLREAGKIQADQFESIVEAIGHEPARPAGYENIEDLPQRYVVMNADVDVVKAFIAEQTRQD